MENNNILNELEKQYFEAVISYDYLVAKENLIAQLGLKFSETDKEVALEIWHSVITALRNAVPDKAIDIQKRERKFIDFRKIKIELLKKVLSKAQAELERLENLESTNEAS